jgi:hypothetical protein
VFKWVLKFPESATKKMLHGTNSGLEAFVKLLEIFQGLALGTELSLVSIE